VDDEGGLGKWYETVAGTEMEEYNQFYNQLHALVAGKSCQLPHTSADWKRIEKDLL